MAEKKKNKPAVTKKMPTRESAADFSFAASPRFKKLAKQVQNGELTTAEAVDMLIPKDLKGKERQKIRMKLAGVMGSQSGKERIANTRQEVHEEISKEKNKKQSRKPAMAYGGMAKGFKKGGYANCGASVKATQKSTMACGGMATHKK